MNKYILHIISALLFTFLSVNTRAQNQIKINEASLNPALRAAISYMGYDRLGGETGKVKINRIDKHTAHIDITFSLSQETYQDDWQLNIRPSFQPGFNWAPHLTPTDKNIIAQHVFRSPALIFSDKKQVLIAIPDPDIMNKPAPVDWYMDLNAPEKTFTLGMSNSRVSGHVLFERAKGAVYPEGQVKFGFYLMAFHDKNTVADPFRKVLSFLWQRWGGKLFESGDPDTVDMDVYVKHTYDWAFGTWKDAVWQEFELGGKTVGAPAFIVNVTQSPNYPGEVNEREFRSIWNQAWFNSLRGASGLYRYARRTDNEDLLKKAQLTKELVLSFPQEDGLFYGLIGTEMKTVEIDGKSYNRSKGWDTYFYGNSNRNPSTYDPRRSPFHILDMSCTALWMLRWYEELEPDARLLAYAENYAQALLKLQFENGFFPGWLDLKTRKPLDYLNNSPETSLSVTFLLKLYQITGKKAYKKAALKAMDAVTKNIVFTGRWEDFETYWSCSRIGSQDWVGKKVERNGMYKQNNFSMYWTAEALLNCYQITHKKKYLRTGQRTLDEMLMTQASWQPWYIPLHVLGGFGVMNADGEWNDARESLFSGLIIRYGKELGKKEYIQRGLAALRASFIMMYCPENPETKTQWEKAWPFFGKADYGFMMENYGHDGRTNREGLGIGEFTIYDWGNGSASEAYNRLVDHYGKKFVNTIK